MNIGNRLERLHHNKNIQNWLLFSVCVVFLFVLPLFENLPGWIHKLNITAIFVFALMSLEKVNKKFVFVGFAAILVRWITNDNSLIYLSSFSQLISFTFIIWIIGTLLIQIMKLKEVSLIDLLQAMNGYLLMAIMFTSLVLFIDSHNPAAYTNSQMPTGFGDLVYYTFITLTTTGYGDIVPLSLPAKELAAIIALGGQFYVAVIVAIIVGKFSNKR